MAAAAAQDAKTLEKKAFKKNPVLAAGQGPRGPWPGPRAPGLGEDQLRHRKYFRLETPAGILRLGEEGRVLVECLFADGDSPDDQLRPPTAFLREAASQLAGYFSGARQSLDIPCRVAGTAFQQAVWAEIGKIPYGQTMTFGELAERVGSHPRQVGRAVARAPMDVVIPVHRVVSGSGREGSDDSARRRPLLLDLEARYSLPEGQRPAEGPFGPSGSADDEPKSFGGILPGGLGAFRVVVTPAADDDGFEAGQGGRFPDDVAEKIREALLSGSFRVFSRTEDDDDDDDGGPKEPFAEIDSELAKFFFSLPLVADGLAAAVKGGGLRAASGQLPGEGGDGEGGEGAGLGLLSTGLAEALADQDYAELLASAMPAFADEDKLAELMSGYLRRGLSREGLNRALERALAGEPANEALESRVSSELEAETAGRAAAGAPAGRPSKS
jgi:methylated-DNA-[protein]-cysteine S-methyltransferase